MLDNLWEQFVQTEGEDGDRLLTFRDYPDITISPKEFADVHRTVSITPETDPQGTMYLQRVYDALVDRYVIGLGVDEPDPFLDSFIDEM